MPLELVRRLHLPGRVAGAGEVLHESEQKAHRDPGGEGGGKIAQDIQAFHLFHMMTLPRRSSQPPRAGKDGGGASRRQPMCPARNSSTVPQ